MFGNIDIISEDHSSSSSSDYSHKNEESKFDEKNNSPSLNQEKELLIRKC